MSDTSSLIDATNDNKKKYELVAVNQKEKRYSICWHKYVTICSSNLQDLESQSPKTNYLSQFTRNGRGKKVIVWDKQDIYGIMMHILLRFIVTSSIGKFYFRDFFPFICHANN